MTEPTLASVLPASTQEAIQSELTKEFKSTLKLPKTANRHLVGRAVDLVLQKDQNLDDLRTKMGLTKTEVDYISKVVDEFHAWQTAQKETP